MTQLTPDNINEAIESVTFQRASLEKKQEVRKRLIDALRAKPFSIENVAAVYADIMDEEGEDIAKNLEQIDGLLGKMAEAKRHFDSGIVLPGPGPMPPPQNGRNSLIL